MKNYTFAALKKPRKMSRIRLKDKTFELFIPEKEIHEAEARLAARIEKEIGHTDPLFVAILNGAFMFTAGLMRELNALYEVTFARYASYSGTESTGTLREIMPVGVPLQGRTVVLLEDIVDTGFTMRRVVDLFRREGAADVRLATLLFKPDALRCDLEPDYTGIRIPDRFVVGYGLDYDGLGRAYRDIYKLAGE